MAARPFHLGWFLGGGFGVHGWMNQWAGNVAQDWMKPGLILDLARAMERACFDYLLLEDSSFVPDDYGASTDVYLKNALRAPKHDPMPLVPLLTQATSRLGVVPTVSTSFYPPFLLARLISTLDHLSDGRVGCNLVTSTSSRAAQNFGLNEHLEHHTRYEMADEFIEVVRKLWDSWEPDAVVADRDKGVFADPAKVHTVDHDGKFFRTRGPLNALRPVQGHPVIVQAGGSAQGRGFAAKNADTIIGSAQTVPQMKAFREDIRERAAAQGRDPDQCKVLFLISPIVADSDAEAQVRADHEAASAAQNVELGLALMGSITGIDFSRFDLDQPLGEVSTNGQQGTLAQFARQGEGRTLRELASGFSLGYAGLVGSPDRVAGQMEEVMDEIGGDGFLIGTSTVHRRYISEITDGLVPALQRRGLTRSAYGHEHFRDNLMEF
jgi:FMN-dependent oxidoreductase (nitrilotriacetate monooxygenase family)